MLSHPRKIVAALLAGAMLASAPAHAAYANATASLNNIRFQLLDLDLTDNITPSITFITDGLGIGFISFYASGEGEHGSVWEQGITRRDYATGSVSMNNGATSSHIDTQVRTVPGTLSSSAFITRQLNFTLSPSTRLLFSAEAETFMQEDGIDEATSLTKISGSLDTYVGGVRGHDEFSMALSSLDGRRTRLLQGSLDNGTSVATGVLNTYAGINLSHYPDTSPVPEPETYGMLAIGLLVLGGAVRKQARRS